MGVTHASTSAAPPLCMEGSTSQPPTKTNQLHSRKRKQKRTTKPEKLTTTTTTESAKRYRKKLARAKPSARGQDPTIARLKWKKIYALMVAVRTHSVLTTMIVMGTKKLQKKTNSTGSHHLHQLQRLKMPTLWTKPITRHRSSR